MGFFVTSFYGSGGVRPASSPRGLVIGLSSPIFLLGSLRG